MPVMSRRYTLGQRAEQVDETRRRITEAAVELHATIGPAETTVSAIAERAGVQRLTVYRHFPDGLALFAACSAHWLAHNPPPAAADWERLADPEVRLAAALRDLYGYYARTAAMWERVLRDAPRVPALQEPMAAWQGYLDGARDTLARPWRARGSRRTLAAAAIGHALDFTTYASLTRHGIEAGRGVGLMVELVRAAAGAPRAR